MGKRSLAFTRKGRALIASGLILASLPALYFLYDRVPLVPFQPVCESHFASFPHSFRQISGTMKEEFRDLVADELLAEGSRTYVFGDLVLVTPRVWLWGGQPHRTSFHKDEPVPHRALFRHAFVTGFAVERYHNRLQEQAGRVAAVNAVLHSSFYGCRRMPALIMEPGWEVQWDPDLDRPRDDGQDR